MKSVLILKSSILGEYSQSNQLIDHLQQQWQQKYPDAQLTIRDLSDDAVPVLDSALLPMLNSPRESLNDTQKAAQDLSNKLIDELKSHDVIVFGAPMYNYGIPTQLKNYFDFIARAGVTFQYTQNGPEGLIKGKETLVISSRGGLHSGTQSDVMTPYLRQFLSFIGLENIEFIYAEGIAMGSKMAEKAGSQARIALNDFINKQ